MNQNDWRIIHGDNRDDWRVEYESELSRVLRQIARCHAGIEPDDEAMAYEDRDKHQGENR